MNHDEGKLLEKIQKLINKAESTTPEEAASIQSKISELVLKHNLDLSKLPGNSNSTIPVEIRKYQMKFVKTESDWTVHLLHQIAINNMGKAVFTNLRSASLQGNYHVDILGEKQNIDLIIFIFEQLVPRIKEMRTQAFKQASLIADIKKNSYFRAYSREVVKAIGYKLAADKEAMQSKYEGSTGLVVVKEAAINEKVAEAYAYGRLSSKARQTKLSNGYGASDGKRDGYAMSIHKGIE